MTTAAIMRPFPDDGEGISVSGLAERGVAARCLRPGASVPPSRS